MRFLCECACVSATDAKTKEEGSESSFGTNHVFKKMRTQLFPLFLSFFPPGFRVFIAFAADILRNGWASYQ
jgi:hypothetical protein